MAESILYPRFVSSRLEEALEDTPVVLVHGPRQCGKTTLARMVGDAAGYEHITFDDDVQLAAAQADPVGFEADLTDRTVLDEVQRVPALYLSLKTAVDRHRRPGRFILTGSTNVLLAPKMLVQRDVRDLARIRALGSLPRLLQLAAGQTARLVNVAEIASAFQLSRPTIRDYVVLLERIEKTSGNYRKSICRRGCAV